MNRFRSCLVPAIVALLVVTFYGTTLGSVSDPLKGRVLTLKEFGSAGTGGNDTLVLQRALNEASRTGRAIQISAARNGYRIFPLYLRSNTTVLLDSGVTLQAMPGFKDGQKLLNIDNVSAVQVIGYGAVLKMNRGEYKMGEYRHCVSITGSSQVAIKGISCSNAGGNGIFVGGSDKKPFSQDITLEDLKTDGSISAGLRLVSARNLALRRSHFSGSHGTGAGHVKIPASERAAGIELLPAGPEARLEQIQLEDNVTSQNAGDGVRIVLSRLTDKSAPVNITVARHRDTATGGSSYLGINDPLAGKPARGMLIFQDCVSQTAQDYGALLSFWNSSGVRASFRGLTVIDPDMSGSTMDNVAVSVKRGGGGRERIGNVEFVRTTIRDTRRQPKLDYYFSFADFSHIGIENVTFWDAVDLSGARHKQPLGLFQGEGVQLIKQSNDPAVLALWQSAEKRDSGTQSHSKP